MNETLLHWASDPYWTDALSQFEKIRRSGVKSLTLDMDAIDRVIFQDDSAAYKLMTAMASVQEQEGDEGYRGAPRLVLALLAILENASSNSAR